MKNDSSEQRWFLRMGRRNGGGAMRLKGLILGVLRAILFVAALVIVEEMIRGALWLVCAFCHDMAAARYGWPLLLLG